MIKPLLITAAIIWIAIYSLASWRKEKKTVLKLTWIDHLPLFLHIPLAFSGLIVFTTIYMNHDEISFFWLFYTFFALIMFGPQIWLHIKYFIQSSGKELEKIDNNHFLLVEDSKTTLLNEQTIESILLKVMPYYTLGYEFYEETVFTMKDGQRLTINSMIISPNYFLDKFSSLDKVSVTKSWIKRQQVTKARQSQAYTDSPNND